MAFEDECKIIEKHLRGTDMGCAYETALSIIHQAIANGYLLFKPDLNNNTIKIEPGIIISKLDIKDEDTLTVTFDIDIWDLEQCQRMTEKFKEQFPNNKIIFKLKGVDLEVVEDNEKN